MDSDLLEALIRATLASSVSVLLIGLLRKPLRIAVGARGAYWLWLLVPALVRRADREDAPTRGDGWKPRRYRLRR